MDFSKLTPEQFKIAEMVVAAAAANNIDPNLLLAQAFKESGFRHIPNSETDAFGVMQIRPSTAELNKLGDITDLQTNISGGARLMRQYLDKYKSPEAALLAYHQGPGVADEYIKSGDLKAVGPKGLDYVINIGESGGFGQPAKADGDAETPKSTNPFADYQSESSKFRQEEEGRNKPSKVNPDDKQGGISAPEMGAMIGAGANALLPMLTDPQVSPRVDTGRAQEKSVSAQDRLELARRNLDIAAPQGAGDLEATYRQNQGDLDTLRNEQKLAEARLRGLPKAPPAMEMPEPLVASEAPSRTKAGASGASNWVRAMGDDVPDVLADQAANMRKDNPKGGQAIIDRDLAARQRQSSLGMGDYDLVRTQGGTQLALPPTTVEERRAEVEQQTKANQVELEQRAEQARLQQQAQAQQLEQQRLSYEAELERVRQQRAEAGRQQNVIAGQVRAVAPLQRALTKAETDAELARRSLGRAQQQPGIAGRVLEGAGVGSTRIGAIPRGIVGGGLGYLGVMSYQEALERFKAGDTSEGVLKALEAGAAGAAMLPPAGRALTKARGAGAVGLGGALLYEGGKRLFKQRPPEQ